MGPLLGPSSDAKIDLHSHFSHDDNQVKRVVSDKLRHPPYSLHFSTSSDSQPSTRPLKSVIIKLSTATLVAFAAGAIGAPSASIPRQAPGACSSAVKLDAKTNVFKSYTLHANSFYRAEIEVAVKNMSNSNSATALKVADIGTFLWLDTIANIARLEPALKSVSCNRIVGLFIYDLPGRDCAAKASNGELEVGEIGELSRYKTEYIDAIAAILKRYPNTAFALVVEPDSLPNLVTNAQLTTCQQSAKGYRDGVAYALKTLNLPNVVMYIDAGHGCWLGWHDNPKPGAAELANAYKAAGSPSQLRGLTSPVGTSGMLC